MYMALQDKAATQEQHMVDYIAVLVLTPTTLAC